MVLNVHMTKEDSDEGDSMCRRGQNCILINDVAREDGGDG